MMIREIENLTETAKKKYRSLEIEVIAWEDRDVFSTSFETDSGVNSEIEIPGIDDDWFLG
ncbi:MAG: hypothetical protein IJY38_02660 [Clostridia bacterium]|nr:hypothetical protein [Clostridia bacterium]